MRLTVPQAALTDVLGWAGAILPKRPEVPILAGVRLEASEAGLLIQAYDFETSHAALLTCEVEEPGEATVSGFLLRGLVSTLADKPVRLASSERELSMDQGHSHYRLGLMNSEDFPRLPVLPPTVGTIGLEPLAAMVASAAHPVDEASPFTDLQYLLLQADQGHLTIVGANRQVIAVRDAAWLFDPLTAHIPLGRFETALRGFRTEDPRSRPRITLGLAEGMIGLSGPGLGGSRAVTTRLYAVEKPLLWQRLIRPLEQDTAEAVVAAPELTRALRRAAFLAGEEATASLTYDPDGWIGIQVIGHANYGEGSDLLGARTSGEEPLTLGINPGSLADSIAAIIPDDGAVRLGFAGQRKPITIRPAAAGSDDRAVTVFMPRDLSRGGAAT